LLDAPWTLHLDVFRGALSARLLSGRSRPDMVAQSASTRQWHVFECKGRASEPSSPDKQKAKAQALRLVSVGGTKCTLHIGAITFFRNETLEFFWCDPEPAVGEPIVIPNPEPGWRMYYSPFVETLRRFAGSTVSPTHAKSLVPVEGLDLSIGMHPAIAASLLEADWHGARGLAKELRSEFASGGYQPDGLRVKAGPSWSDRLERRSEFV
jgi:hypothetical protein